MTEHRGKEVAAGNSSTIEIRRLRRAGSDFVKCDAEKREGRGRGRPSSRLGLEIGGRRLRGGVKRFVGNSRETPIRVKRGELNQTRHH